jgi:hypothetical protein
MEGRQQNWVAIKTTAMQPDAKPSPMRSLGDHLLINTSQVPEGSGSWESSHKFILKAPDPQQVMAQLKSSVASVTTETHARGNSP